MNLRNVGLLNTLHGSLSQKAVTTSCRMFLKYLGLSREAYKLYYQFRRLPSSENV
jgi:hypothetical protein